MPQVGERRSGATETVEWNGSRWMPAASSKETPPEQEGAIGRFFGGAMSTSPLNPMNIARTLGDLPGAAVHAMTDPLKNFFQVGGDLKDVVTNERGGGPIMGRVTSAAEALKHLGGSVPLIGPAGVNAGDKIGNGDIAGGAGELAGLASGALIPKISQAAKTYGPPAMIRAGGAMEHGGVSLGNTGISMGGIHVPLSTLGIAESVMRGDPKGLAVAAAPYALKYGGKGLRAAGEGLESLKAPEPVTMRQQLDAGASKYAQAKGAKATFDDAGYSTPDEGAAAAINDLPQPNMRTPWLSREDLLRNSGREMPVEEPSLAEEPVSAAPAPRSRTRSRNSPAFSHSSFLDSMREMVGEKPSGNGNGNGNGSGIQTYHAQDLLDNPASRAFTERGAAQNRGVAAEVNAEASRGGRGPSLEPGFDAMHRQMMDDRTAGELDLPSEPLTEMEKLAARSAERFGRRFRPEF